MKEDNIDNIIKKGLAEKSSSIKVEKTSNCPSEIELSDYLEGLLSNAKEKEIAGHVKSCYWCIEQLDQAQRARSLVKKPQKGTIKFMRNWIKKNIWLLGTGISFILSFIFSRYFLQFLILTLLMGIKWISTTGGTKTIIMVYEAWKKGRDDYHRHTRHTFR